MARLLGRKGYDRHCKVSLQLATSGPPQGVSKNLLKFSKEKFIIPHLGWNNPVQQDRLGANQIENSFAVKDFEALMCRMLTVN